MNVTYPAAIAISNAANRLDFHVIAQRFYHTVDDWISLFRTMLGDPGDPVIFSRFERFKENGITVEEIRNDGQVTMSGEVIC